MLVLFITIGVVILILMPLVIAIIRALAAKKKLPASGENAFAADKNLNADEYAKKLSELIKIETIAEDEGAETDKFTKYYKRMEALYPDVFKSAKKIDLGYNLLIKIDGADPALMPILLMAHADVVEADSEGWKYPPFSGQIAEGRIWGRGTMDTKGAMAAYLSAIEEIIKEGTRPRRDTYILSTCNEETFGNGAALATAFFKNNGIRLYCVVDEGGIITTGQIPGLKGNTALIGVVEKGRSDIEFVAKSDGGHSSTPKKNNPFARLGALMSDIDSKHPFPKKFTPELKAMFSAVAPYMTFSMRLVFTNMWLFSPLIKLIAKSNTKLNALLTTTIVFTMAQGSGARNVIPDKAWVNANLRYIMHCKSDMSHKILSRYAKKHNLTMRDVCDMDCSEVTDSKSEGYRRMADCIESCFSVPVAPYIMLGMTHSRFLSEVSDCVLRFTPLIADRAQVDSVHGKNENIYVDSLKYAVGFFIEYLKNI